MNVDDIKNVSVVGAGLMGHGIALEFALGGYAVRVHDLTEQRLTEADQNMHATAEMLAEIGTITAAQAEAVLANIQLGTELKAIVGEADVVIEAVSEDLAVKQTVFEQLDSVCPAHTILASNSSTLLPSALASVTQRPDRVLVTHYFNPPHLLPLVEIVRHADVSDETVTTMYDLFTKIGKSPAIVRRELPGFIGNRLQMAMFREALALVEAGIATPEDVDTVVKTGFGRRYAAAGPFEIWAMAGWDVVLASAENMIPNLSTTTEVSRLIRDKVEAGDLGVKTGKGFFEWTSESATAARQRMGRMLTAIQSCA